MDVNSSINSLFEEVSVNNERREQLIKKLEEVVKDIRIVPGAEKPTVTDAKLNVIKTASDLLKDKEDAISRSISTALKKKDVDNNSAQNERLAELVKMLDPAQLPKGNKTKSNIDDINLNKVIDANMDRPITSGELLESDTVEDIENYEEYLEKDINE